MRYLVLLYDNEATMTQPGTPAFDAELAGYNAFEEMAGDAVVGGDALEPVATAHTIRHDGGKVQVTDGPFAETVEVLGGFYVLEAPTLDDAIELARQIPAVDSGAIEVRPMVQWVEAAVEQPVDGRRALVTIHGPETDDEISGSPGWEAGAAEHTRFSESAGPHLIAAGAVHPTSTATTLRRRDGELRITDGSFSDALEVVGGFYLLGGSEQETLDVAASVPVPEGGWVEVRPIMNVGD